MDLEMKMRQAARKRNAPSTPAARKGSKQGGPLQGMAKWRGQAGKLGRLADSSVGAGRTYVDVWKVSSIPCS
jgi:hypothetical protein